MWNSPDVCSVVWCNRRQSCKQQVTAVSGIDLVTIEVWKNFNDMQIRFIDEWAVWWWYLVPHGAKYRPLGGEAYTAMMLKQSCFHEAEPGGCFRWTFAQRRWCLGPQVTARHVRLLKSARVGRKIAKNAVYRGLGAAFLAIIRPTLTEFKSLMCLSVTPQLRRSI